VRFRRTRSGAVESELSDVEASVLASSAAQLLHLVAEDAPAGGGDVDPLEAMVGLSSTQARPPEDPALRRLLPDAYRDDAFGPDADPDAASAASHEFRRFTEADLRAGKRAHAVTVLETLAPLVEGGGRLRLDRDQADAWLGLLNDVRLVLGVNLDVDEDTLDEPLHDEDDPRTQALGVYSWLGWVQESLLQCLEPRDH
jgi:hypothetical protein